MQLICVIIFHIYKEQFFSLCISYYVYIFISFTLQKSKLSSRSKTDIQMREVKRDKEEQKEQKEEQKEEKEVKKSPEPVKNEETKDTKETEQQEAEQAE